MAALLRFDFALAELPIVELLLVATGASSLHLVLQTVNRPDQEPPRIGTLQNLLQFARDLSLSGAVVVSLGLIFATYSGIPRGVFGMAVVIAFVYGSVVRVLGRLVRHKELVARHDGIRTLVYGAGASAEALINLMISQEPQKYRPVVALDDDPQKQNGRVAGLRVAGSWESFFAVAKAFRIEAVVIAIPSANSRLIDTVVGDTEALHLKTLLFPPLSEAAASSVNLPQVQSVNIEDFLGRAVKQFDDEPIRTLLKGQTVLVTGAGGSIGSELCKQISRFNPGKLVMADRDETSLLGVAEAVSRRLDLDQWETFLGDIRDSKSVEELFGSFQPRVVFHAAALKHVSFLERFPDEAWKTNVMGTLNVLEASRKHGIGIFVNISTDKAVNPKNNLGRTKKIGEQLTAWFGQQAEKPYVSVRFGNVFASRGSLVPILNEQIRTTGTVKVTHEEAARFFISIREAVALTLQAAIVGKPEEILVLEMGEPIRIVEIAKKLISLSGRQVSLQFSGLKPGEKLVEELFASGESARPSANPNIYVVTAHPRSPLELDRSALS